MRERWGGEGVRDGQRSLGQCTKSINVPTALSSGRFIMATHSGKDAFWPSTSGTMPTPPEPSMGSWLEPFMGRKGSPKTGEKRSHITN
jgi:hypothetical protein